MNQHRSVNRLLGNVGLDLLPVESERSFSRAKPVPDLAHATRKLLRHALLCRRLWAIKDYKLWTLTMTYAGIFCFLGVPQFWFPRYKRVIQQHLRIRRELDVGEALGQISHLEYGRWTMPLRHVNHTLSCRTSVCCPNSQGRRQNGETCDSTPCNLAFLLLWEPLLAYA